MKRHLIFGLIGAVFLSVISVVAKVVPFRGGTMRERTIEDVRKFEAAELPLHKKLTIMLRFTKRPELKKEQNIAGKIYYRVVNETDFPIEASTPIHKKVAIAPHNSSDIVHMDRKYISIKSTKRGDPSGDALRTEAHLVFIRTENKGKNLVLIPADSRGETYYMVRNELDVPIVAETKIEKERIEPGDSAHVERGSKPWMEITTAFGKKFRKETRTLNHFIDIEKDANKKIVVKSKP